MSSCKAKKSFPIKKGILINADERKCPVVSNLLPDGIPLDMCTQSESAGIEQIFYDNTSSRLSLIYTDESESNLDPEFGAEVDETVEHDDVQSGFNVDSNDDSDCVVIDDIVPTVDITEEVSDEENQKKKRQVNQGFNEIKHQFCKEKQENREGSDNEIEKSHRNLTFDPDSEVFSLSNDSDSEQIGSAEKNVEFEEHPFPLEDQNNNQSLPDGWFRFRHDSGLYAYYHVESKVCTMSPPYALGPDSARHHKIPIQAIPCLDEQQQKATAEGDVSRVYSVSPKQVHAYCKNLFKFKTSRSIYYRSWKNKRWYDSMIKRYQVARNPSFNIVKLPVINKCGKDILVPFNIDKPYLVLLSEYVNFAFKKQVKYCVEPLPHRGQYFLATVFIDGCWNGSGIGPTKKLAKNQAARLLLSAIFGVMPELKNLADADKLLDVGEQNILDDIDIDDSRVVMFCKMKNEMLPFTLLETALGKNKNLKELVVQHRIVKQGGGFQCEMQVGRYSAAVKCLNKVDGKHRAAQVLLKQIHPIVKSWGGLVRLYRESLVIEQHQVHDVEVEVENEICEVDRGLLNKLKCEFSKMEQDRREQSEKGIKKTHYDILWEPRSLQYTPPFGFANVQTNPSVHL